MSSEGTGVVVSGEELPRLPTQFGLLDSSALPTPEALIEDFKRKVAIAATRSCGSFVVFVAQVREIPSGQTASVIQTGATRGGEAYLTALLTALWNGREAGFVSDVLLRQFAKRVRDLSNGRP